MNGTIFNCYNKSNLNGKNMVGGIAGQVANNSIILKSYNLGNVNCAESNIGGITGALYNNSVIERCYNRGKITGEEKIGGISGDVHIKSMLNKCYNIGNVTGNNTIGGIVGIVYEDSSIQNIYNINDISGDNTVGGIAGRTTIAMLQNGYNIGNITGGNMTGGIVGEDAYTSATIINMYLLENTVNGGNGSDVEGVERKNEEELKNIYTVLGNAFKEDTNNINSGYPILSWQ